jgi:hypothetical protein
MTMTRKAHQPDQKLHNFLHVELLKTKWALILVLATAPLSATAEARCLAREIWGNYVVQVQAFDYNYGVGCDLAEIGCGTDSFFATCTFRITRNSANVTNLRIACPTRTIPSDLHPKPFNASCVGGCPHHQLHAVGNKCEWDLVDLNGDPFRDITYRVTFSADRQTFVGVGAAGPQSDVDHDGLTGTAASLTGIRQ